MTMPLSRRLYGPKTSVLSARPQPNLVWIATELRRKGVTPELLHLEYLEAHPDGYRYTRFCELYRDWKRKCRVTMRQEHKGGEKAFVDYSGARPEIVDPSTGEVVGVELFVGVLGASNYTYAEATMSQKLADFAASHVRMLTYFCGTTEMIVPDQLKSAVRVADRYAPTINRTYAELGAHYGMAVVPTRPRKPKDKAKAEVAVQVAQRWILARLRHQLFYSLDELNTRIHELLKALNDRPMKHFGHQSRRDLFELLDRPALRPLPASPYVPSDWKVARVAPDYHVAVDHHYYSVPYTLNRTEVEVRLTAQTVEVFYLGRRVASHLRSQQKFRHTTDRSHMPEAHLAVFEGGRSVRAWADGVGQKTRAMVEAIFAAQPVEMQGWRSAQGLRRLESKYGADRLEAACGVAVELGATGYKSVERILKLGRDEQQETQDELSPPEHGNIRGEEYYQ